MPEQRDELNSALESRAFEAGEPENTAPENSALDNGEVESAVRDWLRSDGPPDSPAQSAPRINTVEVIARARRRRRPRRVAVGAISTAAAVGLVFAVVSTLPGHVQTASELGARVMNTQESAPWASEDTPAAHDTTCRSAADTATHPLAPHAATASLRLDTTATASDSELAVELTLTNTTDATVTGAVRTLVIAINSVTGGGFFDFDQHIPFELDPGEQMRVDARVPLDACGPTALTGEARIASALAITTTDAALESLQRVDATPVAVALP